MKIPASLNSILWKILALLCVLAAIGAGYRFIRHDRIYVFDLSYLDGEALILRSIIKLKELSPLLFRLIMINLLMSPLILIRIP